MVRGLSKQGYSNTIEKCNLLSNIYSKTEIELLPEKNAKAWNAFLNLELTKYMYFIISNQRVIYLYNLELTDFGGIFLTDYFFRTLK